MNKELGHYADMQDSDSDYNHHGRDHNNGSKNGSQEKKPLSGGGPHGTILKASLTDNMKDKYRGYTKAKEYLK